MAKILCVLYPDPVDGYPKTYARDEIPQLGNYPDGQTLPSPRAIDFTPGALLGSTSGELGLRKFLESGGHEFVVTGDKDGPGCVFERELPTAEDLVNRPPGFVFRLWHRLDFSRNRTGSASPLVARGTKKQNKHR